MCEPDFLGAWAPGITAYLANGGALEPAQEMQLARPHRQACGNVMSRVAGILEAISAQGAQLVDLPPYSPDLNPIEQAFAKFMAALRRARYVVLWSKTRKQSPRIA
jgi:hypothetical protein